jgi:hypothetical protein
LANAWSSANSSTEKTGNSDVCRKFDINSP